MGLCVTELTRGTLVLRKLFLPTILFVLAYGFWISPNFKTIAAGLALFLFGMVSLEQGFKAFTGGTLENLLRKSTDRVWKSILLGITSTTIMQSSSLVSLITISFLSAGLMGLGAGIGIIFGANLGTTTGAWLVAGFGLKVNIAAYSMPLLVFGVLLIFQNSKSLKGIGHGLAGLGLLFLGIHYMKEGFDAFSQTIDLADYAVSGYAGLFLFTAIGVAATVVLQSSHATLVLIITALAAQQITYENAMALAIGANVGTTITAMLGAVSANIEGKRLAVAHLIFNVSTGLLAIVFISQLIWAVDWVSMEVGIRDHDYTLKLAVFHTLFNLLGLVIMTPFIGRMVVFLERVVKAPATDRTQPVYLNNATLEVPTVAVESVRKELIRLYENAFHLIAHGLSLHRVTIKSTQDLGAAVAESRRLMPVDMDEYYERHIKPLYSAIVDFISQVQAKQIPQADSDQLYVLREAGRNIVEAVKDMKHLHKNLSHNLRTTDDAMRTQYDAIRLQLASILRELNRIEEHKPDSESILSLDAVALELHDSTRQRETALDELIRKRIISSQHATSLMNDNSYTYDISSNLLEMARPLFGSIRTDDKDAELQLSLAKSDIENLSTAAKSERTAP
jgi:phosphate:Na+ symporter